MANLTVNLKNHQRLQLLRYVNADLKAVLNGTCRPTEERLTKLYELQKQLTQK